MSFQSKSATVESGATEQVDFAVGYGEVTLVVTARAESGELRMAQAYTVSGTIDAGTAFEYSQRVGSTLPAFCVATTVAPTPTRPITCSSVRGGRTAASACASTRARARRTKFRASPVSPTSS